VKTRRTASPPVRPGENGASVADGENTAEGDRGFMERERREGWRGGHRI